MRYDFETSKHSILKGWFNQSLIKTKEIDVTFGKTYSRAYEKRQKADYDDYAAFKIEEVLLDLENGKKFVNEIKAFMNKDQRKKIPVL